MKKGIVLLFAVMFLFSCQKKSESLKINTSETTTNDTKFEMYNMSEMALLMEQLYVDNTRLKELIQTGDSLVEIPDYITKIHSAVMTDPSDNDDFYQEQANMFLEAHKAIYSNAENKVELFNKAVDACISCHQKKCSGPIPRIKKLYITQ